MVRDAGHPRQWSARCRLDEVGELADRARVRPPAVFVLGPVVDLPGVSAVAETAATLTGWH